jgi:hypothetical protein
VSQQTTNRSFDDLARALAEGSISRRGALKLFAGTAIAALIPSRALADDDDDDCVRICHVPFDRQTRQCFFGQRENRCVPRSRVQVHLENHPCDCMGRCRNCRRPTCGSIGATCTANDQCCSGRCAGGMCAEPCPSGTVLLCNGTCAKTCTSTTDCTGCRFECAPEAASDPPRSLCSNPTDFGAPCTTDCDCPSGQFCREFTGVGGNFCLFAC